VGSIIIDAGISLHDVVESLMAPQSAIDGGM
jgi:hypothetical protein